MRGAATLRPAVGYIRMSTDKQEDSPARQRQDILALAERLGYQIDRWYEDHGLTGTESRKRQDFQKLLQDARDGKLSGKAVLLSEQSRMSREDIFDVMAHWKLLRDAGTPIVTCQRGTLSFDNLGGLLTAIVDQYGAREESIKLADRVVSGKRLALSKGQRQGGGLFGFDREIRDEAGQVVRRVPCGAKFLKPANWSSRLVVSAEERAVDAVRLMFNGVADGLSYASVAKDLNRRGYRMPTGGRFHCRTIRRVVTNRAYVGDLVAGVYKGAKFRSLRDEGGHVAENAHEPLVSRDLFNRVQRVVQQRHRVPRATTPGRYLLTGLVFADNGWRLTGATNKGKRYYAMHPRYADEHPEASDLPMFRADIIEQGVLAKLREYLADERNQRTIRAEITRRTRKTEANVASTERRLDEVRAKIDRGTENLALASPADVPGISRLLAGWREDEAKLKESLNAARGGGAPTPEAMQVMSRFDQILDHLGEADRDKFSFAIRHAVKRITLRRTRRGQGEGRVTMWDGAIELRDGVGVRGTIPLADDDIPAPASWRLAVRNLRERGAPAYAHEVASDLGLHRTRVVRMLRQAILAGKVQKVGVRQGYVAV
jgi:DNA invertase Pin-like site-specific DNA recombinase